MKKQNSNTDTDKGISATFVAKENTTFSEFLSNLSKQTAYIEFKNFHKLKFAFLDEAKGMPLSAYRDMYSKPIYEGNDFFNEQYLIGNLTNAEELEKQYLAYLETIDEHVPLIAWLRYQCSKNRISVLPHYSRGVCKDEIDSDVKFSVVSYNEIVKSILQNKSDE